MNAEPGSPAAEATHRIGRLTFRLEAGGDPGREQSRRTGEFALSATGSSRPALVYVPANAGPEPMRLVVVLHGAGGDAERGLALLRGQADRERLVLLAPKSRGSTWDVISGGFGPDVEAIDRLLDKLTRIVDVSTLAVGGFSDGASYALTLGMGNGDVFDHVIAFSPGFTAPQVIHGRPRFFLSHGTQDRVLPIQTCSRRLVPALEDRGYAVTYREFDGGHEVPTGMPEQAVRWLST